MTLSIEIVKPKVKLMTPIANLRGAELLLEKAGRVCYKSEDKIKDGSAEKLLEKIIKRGHESVLEHVSVSMLFIMSRTASHQIVRHRIGSYSQESQRYCNYGKSDSLQVVPPKPIEDDFLGGEVFTYGYESCRKSAISQYWLNSALEAYRYYNGLLMYGWRPEDAREVLPNCTKTEIVVTYNLRQWRWFFEKRCDKHAQEQIRTLAKEALKHLCLSIPTVFKDQYNKFIETAQSAQ